MGNIQLLQDGLRKLWTDELYSEQFRTSPSKYKDFDHALKHVLKATVKLLEMTEEADHEGASVGFFGHAAVRKYVADIVISAARLANVSPTGPFSLEQAIFERIERKMGAKLDVEPDLVELLRKIRDARLNSGSSGQALSMIECLAREAVDAAEKVNSAKR